MLRKVFISFASFAVRTPTEDLDGAKFSKLCKDAKLLGRNLSTIEVDIVFAKVKVCYIELHCTGAISFVQNLGLSKASDT